MDRIHPNQQQPQLPPNIPPNRVLSRFPTLLHSVPARVPQLISPVFDGPLPVELVPANMHPDLMTHLLVRQAYDQNGQMSFVLVGTFPENPLLNQPGGDDQEMNDDDDSDRQTDSTNSGSETFRREGSDVDESENDEMGESEDLEEEEDEDNSENYSPGIPEDDHEEWYNRLWQLWEDELIRRQDEGIDVAAPALKRERMSQQMISLAAEIERRSIEKKKANHPFGRYFPFGFTADNIEYVLNPTNNKGEPWVPPAERRSMSKDLANRNIVNALFAKFNQMIQEQGVVVMEDNDQFF